MALSLTLDKASYTTTETMYATLTGGPGELSRQWFDLGSPGGIPSGLQGVATPALTISDSSGRTWTRISWANDVAKWKAPAAGASGSATITVTYGAATVTATYTVGTPGNPPPPPPPPAGSVKLAKVSPWFNPFKGALINRADALLAPNWVGGMSAFARWDQLTSDGRTWNFSGFDKVSAAAARAGKPWALMVILGSNGNGLPQYVIDGVPANNWISTDSATFPVFWSVKANQYLAELMDKLADRYKNDRWLAQVRVVGFWSTHGEPWFAGGESGKPKWAAAWRATHTADAGLSDAAALVKVQDAYDAQDRQWWADQAARWPARVSLAAAAGDALYDNALSPSEWHKPGRHPRRLANWTLIRQTYGARSVFQFNGVGAQDGASGYGRWLPNSFGPTATSTTGDAIAIPAERRGRIGAQPVSGIGDASGRLTFDGGVSMIRHLTAWGFEYCEVYGSDVAAAIDATAGDWKAIKDVFIECKDKWAA